jgi:hypothetical protein
MNKILQNKQLVHVLEELTEGRGHMLCQDCGGKLVWNLEGHGATRFDISNN